MTFVQRGTRILVALFLVLLAGTVSTHSQEKKGVVPRDFAGLAAFRLDSHLGHRSVLLAERIPAESYGWRPSEGVRSVGELFRHVASSYYWFAVQLGAQKPADLPLWKEIQGKEETVDALSKSVEFLGRTLQGLTEEDLDREIDFYGRETTSRELVLNAMTHGSEHLGQAIAYARSLGLAPPWSDG